MSHHTRDGDTLPAADRVSQEPPFSHIVRLVRTALNVPFAAVQLCAGRPSWLNGVEGFMVNRPDALHPLWTAAMAERRGGVLAVADLTADPRFAGAGDMDDGQGARSFAGVPLTLSSGANVGVLYAADLAPRAFLAGECSMLVQLGDCVIRELELRERAACDDLTGFLTRKPFFDGLHGILDAYMRKQTPATLAILDLDHFKTINDRFGHATGDRVLLRVSDACRTVLTERASFGRLGGEEFAFAFPGLDLPSATRLLQDLRTTIGAIRLAGVPEMIVTGSIGVAGLNNDIPTASAWCKMADAALYSAKQAGRNCVHVAHNTRALPSERSRSPLILHHGAHSASAPMPHDGVPNGVRTLEHGADVMPLRARRSEAG